MHVPTFARPGRTLAALVLTLCASVLCLKIPAVAQEASAPPKPPAIRASAAILMDAESGQILYAKNPDLPRPPASTTKIMTAILLLENTRPEEVITASKRASEVDGSALYLRPGEKVTARDMLYALMLRSANDGCVAVAEHIDGSEGKFTERMNRKAREIGAVNTLFRNCNGLNKPANRTTARDLALMARYAFRYPAFNETVQSRYYTIQRSIVKKDVVLKNHARFLWKFPGADGVKTGYTVPAGRCFVGSATWNGWRLISVVLNSPDIVAETGALMKYGFKSFEVRNIVESGQVCTNVPVKNGRPPLIPVAAKDAIRYAAPKGQPLNLSLAPRVEPALAPVAAGATVGVLEVFANGKAVGSTPLVATGAAERALLSEAGGFLGGWMLWGGFTILVVGYAAAFTKNSRLRRDRVKALLRGYYRRRQGNG
jgi:D-alanyl-D-alanine carboxypeptidase (penicillin-binding protein 5/6)